MRALMRPMPTVLLLLLLLLQLSKLLLPVVRVEDVFGPRIVCEEHESVVRDVAAHAQVELAQHGQARHVVHARVGQREAAVQVQLRRAKRRGKERKGKVRSRKTDGE